MINFSSSGQIAGTLGVTGGNWNGAGSVGGLTTSTAGLFTIASGATLNAGGQVASGNDALQVTGGTMVVNGTLNAARGRC